MNCRYCDKWLGSVEAVEMEDPIYDYVHFCNDNCLSNYITVQIFKAKEAIAK